MKVKEEEEGRIGEKLGEESEGSGGRGGEE